MAPATPILELKLFRNRSFAIAGLIMFVLGVMLYGSTTLLPLFVQELLGYTAELSGMVLSPGGIMIIAMLPLVGILAGRVEARWMVGVGFAISAIALFYMCGLNLQIDFTTAMMYRIYQSVPFLFIPINTAAFAAATGENSNQISSIVNLPQSWR